MPASSQPQFKILVANFSQPMPSLLKGRLSKVGPTKIRTGFEFRHISMLGFAETLTGAGMARSVVVSTTQANFDPFLTQPPQRAEGTVTVSSNVFNGTQASLLVGPYELASNRDFEVGGGAAATATNIATAISNLPGYDATPVGADVQVMGPEGSVGDRLRFTATYRGGTRNFTFTYTGQDGLLAYPNPDVRPLRPPTILP